MRGCSTGEASERYLARRVPSPDGMAPMVRDRKLRRRRPETEEQEATTGKGFGGGGATSTFDKTGLNKSPMDCVSV
jgi:hypothetical protein